MKDPGDPNLNQSSYTVIARRYRPRSFTELVGQDHVAQALGKAIESGRVGHAYLFTGARGVGKTSTARIFAKALSIPPGAADELADEISSGIDSGSDMDVIEIDGASNRGIEEIRQLRANVNVRPSRAKYKIYIIDEVHMLTDAAFNALLKTLEEPPEHVKFIFCTTNPDKMPITVLSRCQRFDFAPVKFETIQERLAAIAKAEGFEIEPDALALLARRAAGSMRDSQSLLEQVVSFASGTITAQQVHSMLGTADEGRLLAIVQALRDHDPLTALSAVHDATTAGADAGLLAEQLLSYLRDVMTAGIGGSPQLLNIANPAGHAHLKELASGWGVQTILSAIQILDEAIARMRASVSAATLLEVALIQITQLEHLASIPALLEAFEAARAANPQKKKLASLEAVPESATGGTPTTSQHPNSPPIATFAQSVENATPPSSFIPQSSSLQKPPSSSHDMDLLAGWKTATAGIEGLLADYCQMVDGVERIAEDSWKVIFPPGAHQAQQYCEHANRKATLAAAVAAHMGRELRLQFAVRPGEAPQVQRPPVTSTAERMRVERQISENPLVKAIIDVLDGEIINVRAPHVTQSTTRTAESLDESPTRSPADAQAASS